MRGMQELLLEGIAVSDDYGTPGGMLIDPRDRRSLMKSLLAEICGLGPKARQDGIPP